MGDGQKLVGIDEIREAGSDLQLRQDAMLSTVLLGGCVVLMTNKPDSGRVGGWDVCGWTGG